jgi:AspT/YidE/YbjL antiporter-like protein
MEFLDTIFKEHSVIQALIVISMVCALGLALGKVKVRGISLGVTFVFFIGILAGHLGLTLDAQMLNYAENFGLLVFIYALGLQVGPAFFSSWGKSGMKLNLLALSVVFVGIGLTLILQQFSGVSLPDMVGIMSGATTNTPMLGAAQETLQQINTEEFSKSNMTLGLALTYPLGIVGVIFALIVIRKMLAKHLHITNTNEDRRNKTVIVGFEVNNPAIFGRTIQEIAYLIAKRFVISRVWRERLSYPLLKQSYKKATTCLLSPPKVPRIYYPPLSGKKKTGIGTGKISIGIKSTINWSRTASS